MRTELREAFGEVEAEMIGGKLGVRDVDAHPQIMPGAERGRFFREDEDVLVALPAEMPRERRHGLRDQLDAVEIELGEAGGEDAIALRLPFRRQRLVHGEAADIGDDRRPLRSSERTSSGRA